MKRRTVVVSSLLLLAFFTLAVWFFRLPGKATHQEVAPEPTVQKATPAGDSVDSPPLAGLPQRKAVENRAPIGVGNANPSNPAPQSPAAKTEVTARRPFDQAPVLQERQTPPDKRGRFTKQRVVDAPGHKYRFLRIEEDWLRDAATGTESMLNQKIMVADHFLVTIDKQVAVSELPSLLEKLGGKIRRHLPKSSVYLVATGSHDLDVFDAKQIALQKSPYLRIVEPDYIVFADRIPNDSSFSFLWGLQNTGQTGGVADADIDAPEAWEICTGSASVKVGVIDTGVDYTHPDLAPNIWRNPGEIPGNGADDDGNGYIDDIRGWDFINNDNDPADDHYHGTHCAGTIGGVGNNGTGVAGACWSVSLVPLKFLGSDGSGALSDAAEAVMYATSIGVTLTSNSWGGGYYSQTLKDAIDAANNAGILFVAAAGNYSSNNDQIPMYPATYSSSNIIAVAATTSTDERASFSNYGLTTVDLAAPGVSIYSAKPGSSYQYLSGTSMATPHVAGACALLKAFGPSLTHTKIRDAILSSVDPIPAMTGYSVSGGRLNVHKALLALGGMKVSPSVPLIARGPIGGPFAPATQAYTVTNESESASIAWKVEPGVSWISASPAGGTLSPGASATVTVAFNSSAKALTTGSYATSMVFTDLTHALPATRAVSLAVGQSDAFTELFASGNDTDNQSWLFTPDSSGSFYSVQRTSGVSTFPTDPVGGVRLSLSTDSFLEVSPSTPVQFYGTSYASFFVSSKGYVTFGSGESTWAESLSAHFSKPRIAALFRDLDPSSAGSVSWKELSDRVAVTYQSVPQFYQSDSNSFQIEMFFDGRIRITCLRIDTTGGLIGLSRGLGIPTGFVGSDFSSYPTTPPPAPLLVSIPSSTMEGVGTLTGQGSVTLPATAAGNVTVTLKSSNTGEISLPGTVTVPVGQDRAVFDLIVVDDAVRDGAQSVVVTAASAGYASGADIISVLDNDGTGTITLTAPASAAEGVGSIQGTVTISLPTSVSLTVGLTSSYTGAIQVPGGVVIPAGQTSAGFSMQVVDDNRIDGTQSATITAHVDGWIDGTATVAVLDNETTNLAITVPPSLKEGSSGAGSVSISGTLQTALTVSLSSGTSSRLTVPGAVTIVPGATSAAFTLTVPENSLTDGNAAVLLTASAPGFTGASGTTTVLDNDLHHFTLSQIGTQVRGVPFAVTVTAKDVNEITIANFTAPAALAAIGANGGAVSISPVLTSAFSAGVWTGSLRVNSFDNGVVLTANDGAGHTGASNPFQVTTGPLRQFLWSNQGNRPQGTPTPATITARDAGSNLVGSYSGSVTFSGYVNNPQGPAVLITEVNPNEPNEVELTNVSGSAVAIGGWTLSIYDAENGGGNPKTFTLPAGTSCAGGQVFRIQEAGSAPGTFPQFFTGVNIGWNPASYCPVGVLLCDNTGNPVDCVCAAGLNPSSVTVPASLDATQWNGSAIPAPSSGASTYQRAALSDSDSAPDWTTRSASLGTLNEGLTTPFPASIFAVSITPNTGIFTNGTWTGNFTVQQPASGMRFRADNGMGIATDSASFDATTTAVLSLSPTATEGELPLTATLSVSSPPAGPLKATLSSSNPGAATVPSSVTIPVDQTSVTFPVTIVDDMAIDGTQTATITAQISNWTAVTAPLSVLDNENLVLSLSLPEVVSEGSSATATVSALGAVPSNLSVSLVSSLPSRLAVPATVTIAGGTSSATFTVTATDNTSADGNTTATVTATATSYQGASGSTIVRDDDVHHFGIAPIASTQERFVPFTVTVTAYDASNNVLTSFNGTAVPDAAGAGGSIAISPVLLSGFANGVWTGQFTVADLETNVVLSVSDDAGHTGASNAFQVVNPSVSRSIVEPLATINLASGTNPKAQLVLGPDGSLYGTTQYGGSSNLGTVFKMTTAGVLTTLVNFYGANGSQPQAGLILASDGNFYGTTSTGGGNNLGTIFRMAPTGVLTTLVNFSNATGTNSVAPLLQANDGNFYGTTPYGGSNFYGTIFRMSGTGVLTVLANFTGGSGSCPGTSCQAGLIQASDGDLYGVTSSGGSNGIYGTIFKITPGGQFTTLRSFTGTSGAVPGSTPKAALVQAGDGNLYGTTSGAVIGANGTIFKVTTSGVFTHLLTFTSTGSVPGSTPQGALVQWSDGNLYGTTTLGGNNFSGTVFRVSTAGALTTLRHFSSFTDGYSPIGALVMGGDGKFYGVASSGGGATNKGAIYSITPSGTFTRLLSFVNSPPEFKGLLQASDGNFYGATAFGNNGVSTVFKYNSVTRNLSTLATFTSGSSDAVYLSQEEDGNLYGVAPIEGSGQIFRLTLAGAKTTLASFSGTSGSVLGGVPLGGFLLDRGFLYGTTNGGGSGTNYGTVWKISTGGTFTSLASFTNTSGSFLGKGPRTHPILGPDGNYYGTTLEGGSGGYGTIYRITPGGVLTTLVSFTGTSGAYLGSKPNSTLLCAGDGDLYGTTLEGGAGNYGTVFKIAPDGTFTSLLSFTNTGGVTPGATPSSSLVEGSDGNFYGTTTSTNTPNIVYRVTPSGAFTSLANPGYYPNATLRPAKDGYLYGTTSSGGQYGIGSVYRVHPSGLFQTIYHFGSNNDGGSPFASATSSGTYFSSDSYRLIEGTDGYLYGANASGIFRVHQQPAILTIATAELSSSGVTLTASVCPNQDAAGAYFEYGFTTSYGTHTATQVIPAGTTAVPVTAGLTDLQSGAVYHFRLVTVTAQGPLYSPDQTFATPGAPQVITGSLLSAAQTGFALDGSINPLGSSTTYYFEYGTTLNYGWQTPAKSAGNGSASVRVTETVNSLQPATTYHVRLVAANGNGTTMGGDQRITTLPLASGTVQPVCQFLNTGTGPLSGLFKASDGSFYGTTASGGTLGLGTVFRVSSEGSLSTLANFYGNANGALSGGTPQATVIQGPDGNFYGTTRTGGASNWGCVFKMTPNGDVSILASFNNFVSPKGQYPSSNLALGPDGDFYGVTQAGGSTFNGTAFRITASGALSTLVEFTGTTGAALGSSPGAGLTLGLDGNFYGTTQSGGAGGFGTIFRLSPKGAITTLVQFTGSTGAYAGASPLGALVQGSDGSFYGTTSLGGANNQGTIFKVTPGGTFSSLVSFSGTSGSALGTGPKGSLIEMPDGKFYGTTQTGGLNNLGTLFSITSAGAHNTLVNFSGNSGSALGSNPQGDLVAGPDGDMYGITNGGGLNGNGSIFRVTTGGYLTTLVNLAASPNVGRLVQGMDGKLYGATLSGGGANLYGTLFAAPLGGAPQLLTTLPPSTSGQGINARAGLLPTEEGDLYGTALYGGLYNYGSIFRISPTGAYTTVVNFCGLNTLPNPGHNCSAPLMRGSDGNYYGTTANGGSSNAGTVFRLTPAGVQTVLVHFTGISGTNRGLAPQGVLKLGADGNYYGTTTSGGNGGNFGTVFKMTPAGVLTTLVDFTGNSGAAIGSYPQGDLVQGADGWFYGVTSAGGTNTCGSVFKVSPDGEFVNLANFTGGSGVLSGASPTGGLFVGPDGCFYGVTASGGAYAQGTLFRVAPDGTVSSLYSFTGRSDGVAPNNGLALATDGSFYGGNASSIYRIDLPPVVVAENATLSSATSATLNGSVIGESHRGTVRFEYGLTTAYGSNTPEIAFDPGLTPNRVFSPLENLQPFQTYHFRLVATTAMGGSFASPDRSFSTESAATFEDPADEPVICDGFNATGLSLSIHLGFAPDPGSTLTLVNNSGFSPIVGSFNGFPDGAGVTATFGGESYLFRIDYAGGDGNDVTLTAVSQVINFPAIPSKQTSDGPFTLTATASSGLPVSFSLTSGNASATLSGNTVTLTGVAGTVSITAGQAGNGETFDAALPVTRTFAVSNSVAFTQLSSSKDNDFTLALRADGTLWGWGYNTDNELGIGLANFYYPARIGTASDWKIVSAGGRHAAGVKNDGTLWTWGLNNFGQLGDGSTVLRSSPVQVGTENNWVTVSAGYLHTIALKSNGTIWAWGYNIYGALGQGSNDSSVHSSPIQVGSFSDWTALAAGSYHNLAQRSDGTLWGWGANTYGQVGNGSSSDARSPVQISSNASWSGFSAGSYSNIATRGDGTLWTWGRNDEGQLGDGTLLQRTTPAQVGSSANWQEGQAGGYHMLARKTDGSLWSWGRNICGQLGRGTNELVARPDVPRQIGKDTNWQLLSAGYQFSVGYKSDGTLWAWGGIAAGELGHRSYLPKPVASQFGPIAMASGGDGHTAIIRNDGTLWLLGRNDYGALGIGSADAGQHPTPVQPLPGTQWKTVSCGGTHTAAIRSDGTLWTWGYNQNGQLGDGTSTQRNSPVQIGRSSDWQCISAGRYFTVGVRSDGSAWAWGRNDEGEMGNGTASSNAQLLMGQVGSETDWATVACGGYHVLALKQDGTLWGWGMNSTGQLGDGTTTSPRSTPFRISANATWKSISAGVYHSVATRADGSLWTWGYNYYGQLGDGTTTQRNSPAQVGTATDWVSASAGAYHTYATKGDHSLWSWGYNWHSQLGDGGTAQRASPARVGSAAAWEMTFPGSNHTLVTSSDGSLWSCGFASRGATGRAWRNQLVPELVLPALSPVQTVTFPSPGRVAVGETVTLGATSSSGLPVSYLASGAATLSGDRLTVTGPGAITVYAWQPGDSFFQSSDVAVQVFNQPVPTVVSVAPTAVSATSATLNGIVIPNGLNASARFQHGSTPSYSADTPVLLALDDGTEAQSVSTTVTGLQPGTSYHYRLSASNAGGSANSNDLSFKTKTLFQAWVQNSGMSGPNSGPAEDFDRDGIPNLIEYALGADPSAESSSQLPAVETPVDSEDGQHYLTISYRRRIEPGPLTYTLESSADLKTWTVISEPDLEQAGPPTPTGDGVTESIRFRVLPSIETSPAPHFVRLRVTGE